MFTKVLLSFFLWSLPFQLFAQTVQLKASLRRGSLNGSISIPNTSGCLAVLYGAGSSRGLSDTSSISHKSRRKPLTEFRNISGAQKFQTSKLLTLFSKKSGRTPLYLRAETLCGGAKSTSNIVTLNLNANSKGTLRSINALLGQARLLLLNNRIELVDAYPTTSFSKPLYLTSNGTLTFVLEQGGIIKAKSTGDFYTFLDLTDRIESSGFEQGLLGAAFTNSPSGAFYIYYTAKNGGDTVVSRFSFDSSGLQGDKNSEVELLRFSQPYENHNGGHLELVGDDLYIASGDGGSGGDPHGNGQNLNTFLGKILRINVSTPQYSIPPTNPFINQSGVKSEIFAYGLRNPWRFSHDPVTGFLWAGDVGQGSKEEIDIIRARGNYGWNIQEGKDCYPSDASCIKTGFKQPIVDYGRDLGASVTGGYVYRGTEYPSLAGLYIFGDYVSGKIFGIDYDKTNPQFLTFSETSESISSFGIDASNNLYLLSLDSGKIYRVTVD